MTRRANLTRRSFLASAASLGLWAGCRSLPLVGARRPPRRRIALNASTIRPYGLTLREQLAAAVAGGFEGYEPWLKDVRAAKASGALRDAAAFAKDHGLAIVNGIAFGPWASPDAAVRAAGLEETRRDMALLAELGCPFVAASMCGVHRPGSPVLSHDEIAERFAAVCALGDETGVRPLLEYWGHSANLNRLEDALDVLAKVGRPDTAVLADVFHTYRGGGDFAAFARLKAAQLPVLHVNDYAPGRPRETLTDADRIWPGDGAAPWRSLFRTLDGIGADPWLSAELFRDAYCKGRRPDEVAKTCADKCRALFA